MAPSVLEIHLLGPFRVVVDGAAIEEQVWARRKPALLIKLLALQTHHQLHREQVMEFLWPDLDPEAAVNNLHKSIHAARRALEQKLKSGANSHFILTHGQQVHLRAPEKLWIDVEEFEQAAAKAFKSADTSAIEKALALYEGDLLIEDPYEDWLAMRREHLRALRQNLLFNLSQLYETHGQHQQSIERLKEIEVLDSTNEQVHRRLMRLYALTGNRQQALHQYQQCCQILRRELDARPEPATVKLHDQIVSGEIQPHAVDESQSFAQPNRIINSIAILPLVNADAGKGSEYLADGITEGIIYALSRLPELRVLAWSTVSSYRGQQVDPRDVGRELGARAVLNGKISLQPDERIVIKVEMVDTTDGSLIWGESHSSHSSLIFDLEAKIAGEISEKLLLRLTSEESRRLSKQHTHNTEAYHSYLKGRYFWNKRTDPGVREGIKHFRQAIETDPGYALAHAGLADSYVILGSFGVATMPPNEAFPRARGAAMRALEIDDTLAEAHASLAFSLACYDWNWPAAEREFKRSIELKPGYATAHHWYGFKYLTAMGRLDEAIAEMKQAHELDPLSLTISANLGLLLYLNRQYDQAIAECEKSLEMDQGFAYAHWHTGLAYEQKAMFEEAIAEFQKALTLSGSSLLPKALLGHAYAVAGKRDEALSLVGELQELSKRSYVSSYRIAAIYAGIGDKDQAFEWLEQAYRERDPWLIWLKLDPVHESLASDPRFAKLLRRIGLAGGPAAGGVDHPEPSADETTQSLAILPLVNVSDDPEMEYFSDGITESIINNLSQLPQLKIIARSTVFRYKGREIDPREVGSNLGVRAVLTGRVSYRKDQLNIQTELVNASDGAQLWGEQYGRSASDIFEVQEEIAQEITEKLRLKLSGAQRRRLTKRHTENMEAYHAYLKGRYYWNKRATEWLLKGVEHFGQAIDLDPGYASAYAGLSDSYTLLVVREAISPEEGFAKAKDAAAKALEIDEGFAEAHASLGHAMLHNWEWEAAEKELKRALELNPGYPSAHHWYSEHLTAMGRCEESVAELKLAGELDPLSLIISADLGRAFYYARDYDQVMKQEARTLEMDPNFWLSHINLGRAYTQTGRHAEALSELRKASEASPSNTEVLAFLGFAYAAAGRRDEAQKLLQELNEQSQHAYVPPYHFAIVHAGLGEKDGAFAWLERAFEKRAVDLFTLKVEPMFDLLRSDQRFTDLTRRVGLSQ